MRWLPDLFFPDFTCCFVALQCGPSFMTIIISYIRYFYHSQTHPPIVNFIQMFYNDLQDDEEMLMSPTQPDGYLAMPPTGKGSAVLVLHAWWGLNDTIKALCKRLADSGFVAF